MLSSLFFSISIVCVERRFDKDMAGTASTTFFATNADLYQSNERDTFLSFPRNLDRVGRTDGIAALYDGRYLSEDPNVRKIELLVLDEICMHKNNSTTGDPFAIFDGTDCGSDFEDHNDAKPFMDISAIPLDNVDFDNEFRNPIQFHRSEPKAKPRPFSMPTPILKTNAVKEPAHFSEKEINISPIEGKKETHESMTHRNKLMEEIRSTKGTSATGFARKMRSRDESADDSFFKNSSEPLNLRNTGAQKDRPKNSLHAHINKPQSSSAIHSDSFRDAVSFAMQHRRSKLREDSKDASNDASGDSYGFF